METGIYKEVLKMLEEQYVDVAYFKKQGDRRTTDYYEGRAEVLTEVLQQLESHGLRFDEHGASGRRDGKEPIDGKAGIRFVADMLKPDDEVIPKSVRLKLLSMERSIALLEARVKTLSDLQMQHKTFKNG